MARAPRAVVAVLAALCVAGAAGGCAGEAGGASPDATDATLREPGDTDNPTVRPVLDDAADTILVIGDSLVNGARLFGDLGDRLDAAGFDSLEVLAEDGEDTDWAVEEVEERTEVPEVVVIELGTNPDSDPDGFADSAARLVVALRQRGAERIAWLTPVHGRDDRYDDKVTILTETPGIDEVADWASLVRDDPRRLAADGLHPTQEGYTDLAEFLVSTAASLAASSS
jgi:lysophospholipase L1-like esterase